MKKLVIAEKPSVAADLSKALGQLKKFDDRYEGEEYIVSWAIGHLVELFMPEDISSDLKRWSLTTLPIIPKKFQTKPIEKTKKGFKS
jgi:DNA topoisomerase-3